MDQIGSGLTSKVYAGDYKGKTCAIKVFKNDVDLKKMQSEVDILNQLEHDNITKMYAFENNQLYMELLHEMDLFDFIAHKGQAFDETLARYIFKNLVDAVAYLHNESIVHRDLKLENILVDRKTYEVKVADFGFAEKVELGKMVVRCVGTPGYSAPELQLQTMLCTMNPNKIETTELYKCDVFALGVILFTMVFGHPPFKNASRSSGCKYWQVIYKKKWNIFWTNVERNKGNKISDNLKELIQTMLEPSSEIRISIQDVMKHEWVQGEKETKYIEKMQKQIE